MTPRTTPDPSGQTGPSGPTAPDTANAPDDPDAPAPRGTRRSALLRSAAVAGAVVPLCLAGWLGWQAFGDHGGDREDSARAAAPAPPATGSPDVSAASPGAGPATQGPASTPAAIDTPTGASAPTGGPTASTSATPGAPGTPAAPGTSSGSSLAGRTVLLDPGHNPGNFSHTADINRQVDIGNARKECDATGTSTNSGYTEAEFSLDVSRRARAVLTARGATVVLTQDGDRPWGPCIDERARAGAAAHAQVAVSVHGDGGPASGSGFHVIVPGRVSVPGKVDNSAIVAPSQRLGTLLRDSFKAATNEPYASYVAKQGLDTRTDLGGLNLSAVPKVFIECGNMRNSADAKRMTDPQWRQQAAQGIADAVTAFLTASGGTTPG
ncbi:N-acetylmuramoyl-L-alanine amidase [Kitasatospora sp. NPDC054939]